MKSVEDSGGMNISVPLVAPIPGHLIDSPAG
jgi:hypothetical protein